MSTPTTNTTNKSNNVEVEIKVLLGSKPKADKLVNQIQSLQYSQTSENNQLNHYFVGDNYEAIKNMDSRYFVDSNSYAKLLNIIDSNSQFSLRTRRLNDQINDQTFLVIKASLNDTTASNGTIRVEFEEQANLSLDQLDQLLLSYGFQYQAKWSRSRQEFQSPQSDIKICLDCNAGYGYLAEFESIITTDKDHNLIKIAILKLIHSLNLEELDQHKLAKMFDYYNANWRDYYGTKKVFEIN